MIPYCPIYVIKNLNTMWSEIGLPKVMRSEILATVIPTQSYEEITEVKFGDYV